MRSSQLSVASSTLKPKRRFAAATIIVCIAGGCLSSQASADCVEDPTTPYVNCNPGFSLAVTNSTTQSLLFAPAIQLSTSANIYQTEIIGRTNGVLAYDMTFDAAFGSLSVTSGVKAAEAALLALGDVVSAPTLFSSSAVVSSISSSFYVLGSAVPVKTITSTTRQGPGVIDATIPVGEFGGVTHQGNPANPYLGVYVSCELPVSASAMLPTCKNVNGGTFTINVGQTDVNFAVIDQYLIETTTTRTDTTTTKAIYDIFGTNADTVPEPATWTLMIVGIGVVGMALRLDRRRALTAALG